MLDAEAKGFHHWLEMGGYDAVARVLHDRDVSKFNAGATPPITDFKVSLTEHGLSSAEAYIVELLRARTGEFAGGVIGSPFHALCDRLQGGVPSGVKVPPAALLHALDEAGWVDMGRLMSRDWPTKKQVFVAPEVAAQGLSKSELRRMVEPNAAPGLRVV
jgi:hypothetical protein